MVRLSPRNDIIVDENGLGYRQSDLLKGIKQPIRNKGRLFPKSAILVDEQGRKHNLVDLLYDAANSCKCDGTGSSGSDVVIDDEKLNEVLDMIMNKYYFHNTTSNEFLQLLGAGWNLGNSLDSWDSINDPNRVPTDYEQLWHNPITTKEMIKKVKEMGFKSIRIPVTYRQQLDANGVINRKWLERVEEVVNYCLELGLFAIINVHHDTGKQGVLNAELSNIEVHKDYLRNLWEQIGDYFKDYDYRLIFEGFNELLNPSLSDVWKGDADSYIATNILNQTFVDTVRAIKGNESRFLVCNTYGGQITDAHCENFKLPKDVVDDRLIVSVHCYHKSTENIQVLCTLLEKYFTSRNIPVLIGEFGTKDINKDPSQGLSLEERISIANFYVKSARNLGVACFVWDNNNGSYQLLDREDLEWKFPTLAKEIVTTSNDNKFKSLPLFDATIDFKDVSNYRKGYHSFNTGIFSPFKDGYFSLNSFVLPTNTRYSVKTGDSSLRIQAFQLDSKMSLVKTDTFSTTGTLRIENNTKYLGITIYHKNISFTIDSFKEYLATSSLSIEPVGTDFDFHNNSLEDVVLKNKRDIRTLNNDTHTHSNTEILNQISESENGNILYKGKELVGGSTNIEITDKEISDMIELSWR